MTAETFLSGNSFSAVGGPDPISPNILFLFLSAVLLSFPAGQVKFSKLWCIFSPLPYVHLTQSFAAFDWKIKNLSQLISLFPEFLKSSFLTSSNIFFRDQTPKVSSLLTIMFPLPLKTLDFSSQSIWIIFSNALSFFLSFYETGSVKASFRCCLM